MDINMKIKYKPIIITNAILSLILLASIIVCFMKMLTTDLIFSNDLIYWDSLKTLLIVFAIALAVSVIILTAVLLLKRKNVHLEKVIVVILVFFVISVIAVAVVLGRSEYNNSKLESYTYDINSIYDEYEDILYFENTENNSNPILKRNTITNSEAITNVTVFNDDSMEKELNYYHIATSNPLLITKFDLNLVDFNFYSSYRISYNMNDAINPENQIEGMDYYIFETEDYYVYNQVPEIEMAYAHAKKIDGYSMQDFESDILKIREH